ncbi:MAG: hypothetical protein ACXW3Z_14150, partial [Limisphaerales bacterium]
MLVAQIAPANAAEYYNITDPVMAEYQGFWTSETGAKGRLTAQIRPLSNNHYDGFILFNRARSPVTALKLSPATEQNGVLKFSAASVSHEGGDLLAKSQAIFELRDGKISGTFSGELGEGTFEATVLERKSPTLGAKP